MPKLPRRSDLTPTCPACGNNARIAQRLEAFHEPDVQGDFRYEITECEACGEAVLSFEQAEAYERAYAAAVARARNTMNGDRIRELRLRLGKSQTEMEEAFGVGPKTWGRWERGAIAPPGPVARLMWLAEKYPDVFWQMSDAHSRQPQRHMKVAGQIVPLGVGERSIVFRPAKRVAEGRGRLSGSSSADTGNGGAV